jgi:hypothetical protein
MPFYLQKAKCRIHDKGALDDTSYPADTGILSGRYAAGASQSHATVAVKHGCVASGNSAYTVRRRTRVLAFWRPQSTTNDKK